MNVEPQRFALIFQPPTVVLEYRDKRKDSLRHRKMQIPASCLHDVEVAVSKLVRHNNIHLHASVVSKDQVTRLVTRLLAPPSPEVVSKTESKESPTKKEEPIKSTAAAKKEEETTKSTKSSPVANMPTDESFNIEDSLDDLGLGDLGLDSPETGFGAGTQQGGGQT